ncbi:hypothetical protein [Hydrogenispora ethanolica]|uniref:hypothetical protein n=1 Tax=Hydrogenispora ethanolica TaxID=1082276 RepID=UPI00104FB986|nr:hypothetical protein [Hydrogenispora ethanolica]
MAGKVTMNRAVRTTRAELPNFRDAMREDMLESIRDSFHESCSGQVKHWLIARRRSAEKVGNFSFHFTFQ